MNTQKILTSLKEQFPGKSIIQNNDVNGNVIEILCEVEPATNHPDWSLAIAVIDSSIPHLHNETVEEYKVIEGTLEIFIEDEKVTLEKGQSFIIDSNKVHFAKGDETWVEVKSHPGWELNDHIIINENPAI